MAVEETRVDTDVEKNVVPQDIVDTSLSSDESDESGWSDNGAPDPTKLSKVSR